MKLTPLESVAFGLHQNKGAYGLLLGSGISRSAGIPTGWEIVLDLIGNLATLRGQEADPDPEAWFREQFGEAPAYDALVAEFAKTQDERSSLLRSYIEPSTEEREKKIKVPQTGHHAVARLVRDGYVRMIITTNFDPLIEMAIEEAGVVPDLISTRDQIRGARPFHHARCVVLKVNGDYRDVRIRNTETELAEYEEEMNEYLDRVLDEFGLIVCGWSADYDVALANALFRAPSRRYMTYWTVHGEGLREQAERLVNHRGAQTVPIADADCFFGELAEKLESLESLRVVHPMSVAAAVASAKRFIEQQNPIQLHDLVVEETGRASSAVAGPDFGPETGAGETLDTVWQRQLAQYNALLDKLVHILATIAFFDKEQSSSHLISGAIERLSESQPGSGSVWLLRLRRYPALQAIYAAGIAACATQHFVHLRAVLADPEVQIHTERKQVLGETVASKILQKDAFRQLGPQDYADRKTPWSDYLYDTLREVLRPIIPSDDRYCVTFDMFEYVLALVYQDMNREDDWAPPGAFAWRSSTWPTIRDLHSQLEGSDASSPFLGSGLFGGEPTRLRSALERQARFAKLLTNKHAW